MNALSTALALLVLAAPLAHAERIRAAMLMDTQTAAYVDFEFAQRDGQLRLVSGRAILADSPRGSITVSDMHCRDNPAELDDFLSDAESKPYAGKTLAVACKSDEGSVFGGLFMVPALLAQLDPAWQAPRSQPQCARTAPGGQAVLLAMGARQSYCLEDWSTIDDPKGELRKLLERARSK
jgi:hypothetical protein